MTTLCPTKPIPSAADSHEPGWRNYWFLRSGGNVWGYVTYPSKAEAERAAQAIMEHVRDWMDHYGDWFFDEPYEWLRMSEVRFALPLPWRGPS